MEVLRYDWMLCENASQNRLHCSCTKRCLLTWLPDHRVAADKCQHRIPCPHRNREVKRRNHADNAKRMPELAQPVVRSLTRNREARQATAKAYGVVTDINHLLNFAKSFLRNLADFQAHNGRKVFFMFAKGIPNRADDIPAHRRRHPPPRIKCNLRTLHHRTNRARRHHLNRAELRAINRGIRNQ